MSYKLVPAISSRNNGFIIDHFGSATVIKRVGSPFTNLIDGNTTNVFNIPSARRLDHIDILFTSTYQVASTDPLKRSVLILAYQKGNDQDPYYTFPMDLVRGYEVFQVYGGFRVYFPESQSAWTSEIYIPVNMEPRMWFHISSMFNPDVDGGLYGVTIDFGAYSNAQFPSYDSTVKTYPLAVVDPTGLPGNTYQVIEDAYAYSSEAMEQASQANARSAANEAVIESASFGNFISI